jgi:hypothetical protein
MHIKVLIKYTYFLNTKLEIQYYFICIKNEVISKERNHNECIFSSVRIRNKDHDKYKIRIRMKNYKRTTPYRLFFIFLMSELPSFTSTHFETTKLTVSFLVLNHFMTTQRENKALQGVVKRNRENNL